MAGATAGRRLSSAAAVDAAADTRYHAPMAKRPPDWRSRADLLAWAERAALEDLFREIHRVNPTDRGLPTAERDARYGVKTALQDLLVRRFGDALVARPEHDDLVLIVHRTTGRDAAHVRLDLASPETRRWVDDQHLPSEPAPARPALPVAARPRSGDLVDAGLAAQEAWDLDEAERLLTLAASGGGARALGALLRLQVEVLGKDDAAWQRRADVPPEDAALRLLIALAGVRCGHLELAATYAAGLSAHARGDVLLACARGSLGRGDDVSARSWLEQLGAVDPANAGRVDVASELERRALERAAPLVEALRAAVSSGVGVEGALSALESAAPSHPEVARARSALALARRDAARREHLSSSAKAEGEGRWADALAELRQAATYGADVSDAIARVRESERAKSLAAAVASPGSSPPLEAWLAAPSEARAAWLAGRDDPDRERAHRWREDGARSRVIAEALSALSAARVDANAALGLDADPLLSRDAEARSLRASALQARAAQARSRWEAAMEAARAAVAAEDGAAAVTALEGAPKGVDDDALAALRDRAEALAREASLVASYESGLMLDPLRSRAIARRRVAERAEPKWVAMLERVNDLIHTMWLVADAAPTGPSPVRDQGMPLLNQAQPIAWLDPSTGRVEVILVNAHLSHVHLIRVDVETGEVRRQQTFRVWSPQWHTRWHVDESGLLWLHSEDGSLSVLDASTLVLQMASRLVLPNRAPVQSIATHGRALLCWLETRCELVQVDAGEPVRRLDSMACRPVQTPGSSYPFVAYEEAGATVRIVGLDARGAVVDRWTLSGIHRDELAIAADPSGDGLWAQYRSKWRELGYVRLRRGGAVQPLQGTVPAASGAAGFACDRQEGVVWVVITMSDDKADVVGLVERDGAIHVVARGTPGTGPVITTSDARGVWVCRRDAQDRDVFVRLRDGVGSEGTRSLGLGAIPLRVDGGCPRLVEAAGSHDRSDPERAALIGLAATRSVDGVALNAFMEKGGSDAYRLFAGAGCPWVSWAEVYAAFRDPPSIIDYADRGHAMHLAAIAAFASGGATKRSPSRGGPPRTQACAPPPTCTTRSPHGMATATPPNAPYSLMWLTPFVGSTRYSPRVAT